MYKVIRTNFDRHEARRDRRYLAPTITVSVSGTDYVIRNWSLGGFEASEAMDLPLGGQIAGLIRIDGRGVAYAFTAEAVRDDAANRAVGFRFVGLSPALSHALDRAVAARMVGIR